MTKTAIRHNLIHSLRVAAGYDGSLFHLERILVQRKELARIMLANGPSEEMIQAYNHINSAISSALGIPSEADND